MVSTAISTMPPMRLNVPFAFEPGTVVPESMPTPTRFILPPFVLRKETKGMEATATFVYTGLNRKIFPPAPARFRPVPKLSARMLVLMPRLIVFADPLLKGSPF